MFRFRSDAHFEEFYEALRRGNAFPNFIVARDTFWLNAHLEPTTKRYFWNNSDR